MVEKFEEVKKEFEKLSEEIERGFQKNGITREDINEAIRSARAKVKS